MKSLLQNMSLFQCIVAMTSMYCYGFNVVERVNGLGMVKGMYYGTRNCYIPLSSQHS